MRVGIQTISWGRTLDQLWRSIPRLRKLGYAGVEIAQHPAFLDAPKDLYRRLCSARLSLLGLSGGSLMERIAFLCDYLPFVVSDPPEAQPYAYMDGWEQEPCMLALDQGVTLALHPHMFKRVQTLGEASALLQEHSQIRFMPDTAHLTVAGESPLSAIREYFSRLIAVHVKDWNEDAGRSYQFYSRGFTELGRGDVDLTGTFQFLRVQEFQGWLVVEQDASDDPLESAKRSRGWLRDFHNI